MAPAVHNMKFVINPFADCAYGTFHCCFRKADVVVDKLFHWAVRNARRVAKGTQNGVHSYIVYRVNSSHRGAYRTFLESCLHKETEGDKKSIFGATGRFLKCLITTAQVKWLHVDLYG
jgi:hypothetical protein